MGTWMTLNAVNGHWPITHSAIHVRVQINEAHQSPRKFKRRLYTHTKSTAKCRPRPPPSSTFYRYVAHASAGVFTVFATISLCWCAYSLHVLFRLCRRRSPSHRFGISVGFHLIFLEIIGEVSKYAMLM